MGATSLPEFDPSKPYKPAAAALPEFDPAKPYKEVAQQNPRIESTGLESGLAGFAQGISGGWADEGDAAIFAAKDKLFNGGNFKDLYHKRLAEQQGMLSNAQSDNPGTYLGGTAGGAIAQGVALGPMGYAGNAAIGAVTGGGSSDRNPTKSPEDLKGFASDVGLGALTGLVTKGAENTIGKAVSKFSPDALKKFGATKALTASGFMQKDLNKLLPGQAERIGQDLLDKKVVTAFSGLDSIAEKAGSLKKEAGKKIGDALGKVDELVATVKGHIDSGKILPGASKIEKEQAKQLFDENFQFSMKNIGQRIRSELVAPNIDNPNYSTEVNKLSALADLYESRAPKTLKVGNAIKSSAGKKTRFASDTVPEEFKKDVYGILKEELEKAVSKTADLENGLASVGAIEKKGAAKSALSDYQSAKDTYGSMKSAEKVAKSRSVNSNRTFGLTDTIAAGAGFAQGGPVPALAMGALNKIARKYGASVQAVGADKLADGLSAILSKTPALMKRFGPAIEAAKKSGAGTVIATHAQFMNDPSYRSAMDTKDTAISRKLEQMKGK